MKKFLILVSLVFLSSSFSHAHFAGFGGENFEAASDIVVRGTVAELESNRDTPDGIIYTDVTVAVSEYLKGSGEETLTVRFVGGEHEGKGMLVGHMPRFNPGEEAVLYLRHAGTMPGDTTGVFEVVGSKEGKVSLSGRFEELGAADVNAQSTGYMFLTSHSGNYLRWAPYDLPIDFTISEWWLPIADEPVGAVYAGFTAWEAVATASVEFDWRGTTMRQLKGEESGYNLMGWTAEAWVTDGYVGPAPLAVTYIAWYDTDTLFFDEVDIAFNIGVQWTTTGEPNKFDIQGVATHEAGHLLGLAHTHPSVAAVNTVTTMISGPDFYAMGYNVGDEYLLRNLHTIDKQGISILYPPGYPDSALPKGPGGGCFIATAAFGSPLADEVSALSAFRDGVLLESRWGRAFVSGYYALSSGLAEMVEKNFAAKAIIRLHLFPLIRIIKTMS